MGSLPTLCNPQQTWLRYYGDTNSAGSVPLPSTFQRPAPASVFIRLVDLKLPTRSRHQATTAPPGADGIVMSFMTTGRHMPSLQIDDGSWATSLHRRDRRIRARFAICNMALCCLLHLLHLRHRVTARGLRMEPDLIHRALKEPEISILQRTGGRRRFGMPSGANTDTCQIYRTFSLGCIPFWLFTQQRRSVPSSPGSRPSAGSCGNTLWKEPRWPL